MARTFLAFIWTSSRPILFLLFAIFDCCSASASSYSASLIFPLLYSNELSNRLKIEWRLHLSSYPHNLPTWREREKLIGEFTGERKKGKRAWFFDFQRQRYFLTDSIISHSPIDVLQSVHFFFSLSSLANRMSASQTQLSPHHLCLSDLWISKSERRKCSMYNSIEGREYMEPSLTIQRNGKIQLINSASSAISNKICRLIYLFWSAMNLIKLRRIRIIRPQRHGPSISLFFFGPSLRSLLKLKFYAAIEIIQPFFFSSPFSLSHYLQVLWMKTITANILRKQWNFIGHLSTGHNFHK